MLKELFLPEKIKSRRIRSERRVGIHRQDDELFIVDLYLTSTKNILEKN